MRRRALVGMLLVCLVVGTIPISNGVEKSDFSIKVPDELPNGATITDIAGYKEIKDEIEDYYPHAIDGRAYDYSDNSVICILVFSSVTDAQKDFKHSFSTFSELEGGMQFEDFVVYHSEFKQLFDSSSTWIKKNAWIGELDEVTFTLDRYVIFIDPLSIPEGIKIAEMVYSLNQEDSEVTHITTLHDADETGECFDFSQNTKIIISSWVDYLAGTEGDLAFDSGTLVAQDETIPHLIVYKEEEIVSKCKEMGVDDESWDRVKDKILSQIYGDLKLEEISVPETGYEKGAFPALPGLIYFIKCKDEKGYAVIRLLEVSEEGLGMYKFEWIYYGKALPTPTPTPTPTPSTPTPTITPTPIPYPTNGPLKVEFKKITSEVLKIYIENPGPYFVYIPSSTKEGDTNFKISGITWGGKLEAYVESTHPHERWTIYAKDVYKDVKLPVTLVLIVLNPPKSAIEVAKMAGPMLLKSATGIDPIGETLDRFINYALEQKTESFILFTKCFLYCKHPTTKNIEPKESDQFAGGISKSCFAIVTHGVILSPIIYNKAAYNDYKNKYDLPKKGAGYVLLPESRLVIELTYEEIREDKLGLMIKEYQALRGSRGTGRSDDLEYTLLHIYQGNYEGSEHVHSMVRSGTTFDYYSFDSISSISITPSIPPEIDFDILLKPDKPTYRRGETAQVTIDVTNNRDQDTEIWLGTTFKYPTLKDPKDIPLKRAVIPKGETESFDDIEWTIPPDAPIGQYEIAVNCWKDAGQNEDYTDNIVWAPIFNVDTIAPTIMPTITPTSPEFDFDAMFASISDFFEALIVSLNELVTSLKEKTISVPPEQKAKENVEDALGALAGMAEAYYGFMEMIYELSEVEPPKDADVKFDYHVLSARFCNNIAEAQTYMSSGGIKSADMSDALDLVRELELAKTGFCIVIVDYSFIGFGEYESGKYPIVCNEKGDPFWESWQFYEKIKGEIEVGYKEYE